MEKQKKAKPALLWGLAFGIVFGFLLQKGGATKYDVIVGQLLLTDVGAIGNGSLDALVGGLAGILAGSGLFAALCPRLSQGILKKGDFGDLTLPRLFKANDWVVVIPVAALIFLLL